MTWSTPNKGLKALLFMAALGCSQIAHCDEPSQANAQASLVSDDLAALDETASVWANRFANGTGDAGLNTESASDSVSVHFGPSTQPTASAAVPTDEVLSQEETANQTRSQDADAAPRND